MKSHEELRDVESRNQFRAEVGLPLVSVEVEIEKIHRGEVEEAYRHWYNTHPLMPKLKEEVLAIERKNRNDPTWLPRGLLNGGWAFGSQVEKKMRLFWEKEKEQVVHW